MHKILMIDDDREVLELCAGSLSEKGYAVRTADNAVKGLAMLEAYAPDCVLLDVMMPGMDGFEVCQKIRRISDVPVIFLTGRVSEEDKVSGLLLGADDYIEKPCSLKELEARIVVNIRRTSSAPTRMSFPPLEIDLLHGRALCDGEDLNLTAQEFALLRLLASHAGEEVSFKQIGVEVRGGYVENDRRSVMVSMSRLRKKLEPYPAAARMIETVWSKGYRFVPAKRRNGFER